MKIVLVALLVSVGIWQSYAQCTKTVPYFGGSDAKCICSCTEAGKEVCQSASDLVSEAQAVASGSVQYSAKLAAFRRLCSNRNPLLKDSTCAISYLPLRKGCQCPICDDTTQCAKLNARAKPRCARDGTCKDANCTVEADPKGNKVIDVMIFESSGCNETCTATTSQNSLNCSSQSEGDLLINERNLCWFSCEPAAAGLEPQRLGLSEIFASNDRQTFGQFRKICAARNPALRVCAPDDIVPDYYNNRFCGCGVCRETCDSRQVTYETVGGKCVKKYCGYERKVWNSANDPTLLDGEEYVNVFAVDMAETVDDSFCTSGNTVDCTAENVCKANGDTSEVCVTFQDKNGNDRKFTTCKTNVRCKIKDGAQPSSLEPGRCEIGSVTESECTPGDFRVSDVYIATERCPLLGVCVPADRSGTKGAIVRGTFGGLRPILKRLCADELAIGNSSCPIEDIQFDRCPTSSDASICDSMYCCDNCNNTRGGVCREGNEDFESKSIVIRDNTVGCKYCECDNSTDSLTCTRYDRNSVTVASVIGRCGNLNTEQCKKRLDTRGLCGVCPACGEDNDCNDEVIRNGTSACQENPLDNSTLANGTRPAGRVRIVVGAMLCADRFLGKTRSELYGMIKKAVLNISVDCGIDFSLATLRAYIVEFDFKVIKAEELNQNITSSCNVFVAFRAVIHITDVNLARLRKLAECFKLLGDALPGRFRWQLQYASRGLRVTADSGGSGSTEVDSSGDNVYGNARVYESPELYDENLAFIPLVDTTSAVVENPDVTEDSSPETESKAVNLMAMMGGIMAIFAVSLMQ